MRPVTLSDTRHTGRRENSGQDAKAEEEEERKVLLLHVLLAPLSPFLSLSQKKMVQKPKEEEETKPVLLLLLLLLSHLPFLSHLKMKI